MEKTREKKTTAKKAANNSENNKARLEELYTQKLRPQLKETLNLANIMEVPKLEKIVLNVGVKEAVADSRVLQTVLQTLATIAGQAPVKTLARKSIAGFKIREGMPIGVRVTLRRKKMYEFLDKLINLALPKVRDFQGVPTKLDGRGSYNLGIKEWIIFPEADTTSEKVFGLNITIQTTAKNDAQGYELLKSFGMPFRKK
jgi:large subunit ribosomal protein L5